MRESGNSIRFLTLISIFIWTAAAAQAPDTLWTRVIGGPGHNFPTGIHENENGYIIIGSRTPSEYEEWDVYLVQVDSMGYVLWDSIYAEPGYDVANSIDETYDHGFVMVGAKGILPDIYLLRADSEGHLLWTRTYGGNADDVGHSVLETSDRGFIIVGEWIDTDPINGQLFLLKTDSLGIEQWRRNYGGAGSEIGYDAIQTNDGGYAATGRTYSYGAGESDLYIVKTDSIGVLEWQKAYGGFSSDYGQAILQIESGGYMILGFTYSFGHGGADAYVIRTDSSGDSLWTLTFGGPDNDYGFDLIRTTDEAFIGFGETWVAGGLDFYIFKFGVEGDFRWSMATGRSSADADGMAILQTGDGGYLAVGPSYSSRRGLYEIYLVRLAADPVGISDNDAAIHLPSGCNLEQNYPNPFNASTVIKFVLEGNSTVDLTIYDLLGRKITTLMSDGQDSGAYAVRWDSNDLASGVYLARLKANGSLRSIRITLLK